VVKLSTVESDPFNGNNSPLRIPGAYVRDIVRVINTGAGPVDLDSLVMSDPLPAATALFVGDLGAVNSGPVMVVGGDSDDGLTYSYPSLPATPINLPNDEVDFSDDDQLTWNCVLTPDAEGFDTLVTDIRVNPKGQFPGSPGANNPDFDILFRIRID
jgi:hypothetical protein